MIFVDEERRVRHVDNLACGASRVLWSGDVLKDAQQVLLAGAGQIGVRLVHQQHLAGPGGRRLMCEVLHEVAQEVFQPTATLVRRVLGAGPVPDGEYQVLVAQRHQQLEVQVLRPPPREVQRGRQPPVDPLHDPVGEAVSTFVDGTEEFLERGPVDPGDLEQQIVGEGELLVVLLVLRALPPRTRS